MKFLIETMAGKLLYLIFDDSALGQQTTQPTSMGYLAAQLNYNNINYQKICESEWLNCKNITTVKNEVIGGAPKAILNST